MIRIFKQLSLVALTLVWATAAFAQCHTTTHTSTLSTCSGQANGTINLTVTGGIAPFSFTWTGPNGFSSSAQNLTGLVDGSYTCVVYGGNNCFDQVTVVLQSPQVMSLDDVTTNVSCFGISNGSVNLVPADGTFPYTFAWTGPGTFTSTNEDITNVITGTYNVLVTDAAGCKISGSFPVTQPQDLQITATNTNVLCFGQFNGTINTTITGGTTPYTFLWNNNSNNQNLTQLDAGIYTLTVTDAQSCQEQISVTVTQPNQLAATSTVTNVNCFGQSTGAIDVTVTGGTQQYNYSWASGQLTQDITGVSSGSYVLTITDANGCSVLHNRTISQNSQIMVGQTVTHVSCNGQSNGAIALTATGGITPYTYAWTGPNNFSSAQEDITGLAAGNYSLTLTDNLGCNSGNNYTYTVNQPTTLVATETHINILCAGGTGSIDLSPSGGTTPYSYAWTGPNGFTANTQDISNLSSGNYNVTVTDVKGCQVTLTNIPIAPAPTPITLTSQITNAQCFGSANGAINLTPNGGTGTYSYNWSNNATTQDISGVTAGIYTVQVLDANNCVVNQSFTIAQPGSALTASETHTDIVCAGTATGTVNLTVNGGTAPYTYLWSNGLTIEDPTAIAAGNYTVTITDANLCSSTINVAVAELFAPLTSTFVQTNVSCFGGSTGFINLSVNGGSSPFSYVWSNGGNTQDIGGLAIGTYTVTVTDINNCTTTNSVTITQPAAALNATETNVDLLCVGYSTGSVNATVTGGTPTYTYAWTGPNSFTASTEDISGLPIGSYTLIVTDGNNCKDTVVAVINNPVNGLNIASQVQQVSCFGGANGAIDLTISGGSPGYVVLWSNNIQLQDLSNLTAGTYSVTVTDNATCVLQQTFNITQPAAALAYVPTIIPVSCHGDTTGAVTLAVTGGTTPYNFTWTGPAGFSATTEDIYNLGAGMYAVSIADANGCGATYSAAVTQPFSPMSMTLYPTASLCFGLPNGSVDLTIAGGVPGYTYSWSNGATSQDLTAVVGGQYSVTVQDANGCLLTDTVIVGQPSSALTLLQSTTNVTCFGLSNGNINLTVSGGTPGYTYLWTNGAATQDLNNVPAGVYSVVVTDANSCEDSLQVLVNAPSAAVGLTGVSNNILCHGGSTGSIAVQGTGGSGTYSYLWSTGATSATLTGVPAGIYNVVVTDAGGCTATQSWTLTQPTPISLVSTNTNILCYGQNAGSIAATASGGVAPYQYQWSNGLTTPTILNQVAGPYFVTVLDDNGCSATFSDTIYQPASALTASGVVINNVCFGAAAGSIDITASGGTAPYQYLWNTGSAQADLTNLLAGTYNLTIQDANGCTINQSYTVNQPPQSIIATETHQDVSCFGGNNGSINLTVSGPSLPFTYLWSNNATTQDLTILTAGVYNVVITDALGCTATQSITLSQPSVGINALANITNVNCFGAPTGAIDITVTGQTPPFQYSWSNGTGTQDLTNVLAGQYILNVIDVNGCLFFDTFTVAQPTAALALQFNPSNVLCYNQLSGAVDLVVTGGTPGYSYLWNNNAVSQDLLGVGTGLYSVVVTDANGCTASGSTFLTQPTMALTASAAVDGVSCFGGNDGAIDVSVVGGTAPYDYLWSNAAITQDIDTLTAGTYVLSIYDGNGCFLQQTYQVTQSLSPLVLTSTQTPAGCYGGTNGSVNLTVSGGTGPYTYLWNNTATTQDLQNVAAGIYVVTVTDANGCSATLQDTVTQPGLFALSAVVTPVACFGANTGAINLTVIGGTAPYTYGWNNLSPTQDISGLLAGNYSVVVTDASGCSVSGSYLVSQPTQALTINSVLTNVSCTGTASATIDVTVTGGNAPYTYAWNNQAVTQDLVNVGVGTYTLIVTDNGGCQSTAVIPVTQPTPINLVLTPSNPLCPNTATGSVDLTVSGGTAPYLYQWSGPNGFNATTQDIGFIPVGLYFVLVTDTYGCNASQTTSLSNPVALAATYTSTAVQCFGGSNGTIDLSVTGGAAPYTYLWNNNATTQDISNVPAGNSTVVITDSLGCTLTFVVAVTQPSALAVTGVVQNVACFGTLSGAINVSVSGGTPGYSYQWVSGQTTQDLTGLGAGAYTINVTDTNGCLATQSYNITAPATVMQLALTATGFSCFNASTGTLDLSVTGGVGPYTYLWNNNVTTQDQQNLPAGTYSVSVTDVNGCLDSASITITNPAAFLMDDTLVNVQCFGQSTGSIDLTVTGGSQPYFYAWTGPNGFTATTQDLLNIPTGVYNVIVTDFNGCTLTGSYFISQPTSEAVMTATVNDILCYGATTGWINASVVGGALPYQYFWQAPNGSLAGTTEDLFGIGAGWYELFVTDANGCVTSDSILVDSPAMISPNAVISNISCFGLSDGAINVSTTGGVAPYVFQWNTGAPSEDLSGLLPGTYTLTITDANNCVVTNSFTVTQPLAPLTLSLTQQNINCFADSTGSINLTPAGGTSPYSYAWSGPNGYTASTQDIQNLPIGTYNVLVTDNNGCTATTQTTLTQPLAALSLSEVHTNVSCFGGSNGSISISAVGGTSPYTYLWNNALTTATVSGLPIGTYTVLVTDSLGCSASLSVLLTQPQAPITVSSVVTDLICMNDPTGAIDVTVQGGTPGYQYSWSNGPTTPDIDSLESGPYTLTVTDILGCVLTTTITVNNPVNPMVVTPTQNNVSCHGYNDATLLLSITGGQPVYDILWNTGDTVNYLDSLTPGTYSVLVTDAQGCEEPLSFTVTEPAPIVANFVPSSTFGCIPLDVTFTNLSTGPYTNSTWDFGNTITQTTQNANTTLTIPGCYSITLTVYNAIGCADTITMDSLVCVVPGPQASFSASTGSIDYFTGLLELTNTSLGSVISTFWTFGDGSPNSTIENPVHYYPDQQPADYEVTLTVTDTNGCTDTATAVFSLIELLNVYIPNTITIDGDNLNELFLPIFSNPDIIKSYNLQIFNRWGNLVFETDTPAEGWDGRYKGKRDVQLGLYNWKIVYTDNKSVTRTLAGHVNVLR